MLTLIRSQNILMILQNILTLVQEVIQSKYIDKIFGGNSQPNDAPNSEQLHNLINKYYQEYNKPIVHFGYSMGASIINLTLITVYTILRYK